MPRRVDDRDVDEMCAGEFVSGEGDVVDGGGEGQ